MTDPSSTAAATSTAPKMTERAHHRFWPRRLPHSISPPATPLWDNLATSARRYPDKAALVFFDRVYSYAQVTAMAERLAGRLHAMGVAKGDRVLLDMQNCPQLVIAHWAILRANAVVVPINPMNRAEELKHYIVDPDAKVAITTGDLAAEIARANAALPAEQRLAHLIVTQFTDAFDPEAQPEGTMPEASPEQVSLISDFIANFEHDADGPSRCHPGTRIRARRP